MNNIQSSQIVPLPMTASLVSGKKLVPKEEDLKEKTSLTKLNSIYSVKPNDSVSQALQVQATQNLNTIPNQTGVLNQIRSFFSRPSSLRSNLSNFAPIAGANWFAQTLRTITVFINHNWHIIFPFVLIGAIALALAVITPVIAL